MNVKATCRSLLAGFMILLVGAPPGAFGQTSGSAPAFNREELDQMLAPIALYPDSLLAQVLVAATYPIEVVAADRWLKQNGKLKGERLNDAVDQMKWDLSVKALVPFPQVLAMMSEQLEWTQTLGEAFLAQQADVMDAIQNLRAKAQAQGNLRTTKEQKVVVQEKTIVIEPVSPTVVYVPAYNPAVVYGPWWYPAYPPYPYYPAGAVVTAGVVGFAAGVAVGTAWNGGWGHWNWGGHDVNVNVNRNLNINRNNVNVSNMQTGRWQHDVNHRGGVAYQNQANRNAYGRQTAGSVDGRRDYRGYSQDRASRDAGRQGAGQFDGKRASQKPGQGAVTRPSGDSTRKGVQQPRGGGAFGGAGSGKESRMSADRGRASRETSSGISRGQGPAGSRSSIGGGGFSSGGGGFKGGGGGGRGGSGGGRGGGGRR